jgi:hypothetical protein
MLLISETQSMHGTVFACTQNMSFPLRLTQEAHSLPPLWPFIASENRSLFNELDTHSNCTGLKLKQLRERKAVNS